MTLCKRHSPFRVECIPASGSQGSALRAIRLFVLLCILLRHKDLHVRMCGIQAETFTIRHEKGTAALRVVRIHGQHWTTGIHLPMHKVGGYSQVRAPFLPLRMPRSVIISVVTALVFDHLVQGH